MTDESPSDETLRAYQRDRDAAIDRAEAAEAQLRHGRGLAERIAMARELWRAFRAVPVDRHAERGAAYAAFLKAEEYACLEVSAMCRDCNIDPQERV